MGDKRNKRKKGKRKGGFQKKPKIAKTSNMRCASDDNSESSESGVMSESNSQV